MNSMNTKDAIFSTIVGILLAPYLARIGIPPTSPEYPVLIGAIVGALPLAYHTLSSVLVRVLPQPTAAQITPEQFSALVTEIQKLTAASNIQPPTGAPKT